MRDYYFDYLKVQHNSRYVFKNTTFEKLLTMRATIPIHGLSLMSGNIVAVDDGDADNEHTRMLSMENDGISMSSLTPIRKPYTVLDGEESTGKRLNNDVVGDMLNAEFITDYSTPTDTSRSNYAISALVKRQRSKSFLSRSMSKRSRLNILSPSNYCDQFGGVMRNLLEEFSQTN